MDPHAVRIGVLMGGPSAEHAISLRSGQGAIDALTRRGWHAAPLVIPQDLTIDQACRVARVLLEQQRPSVVFVALHGPFGEDGTIQQLCEDLSLPYTGSDPAASRLGMDKVASRQHFEHAGLCVPRWRVMERAHPRQLDAVLAELPFPVVVKPTNQGSSIGVSIARTRQELTAAMEAAGRYDTRILVEEYLDGRELTVGVVDEQALPVIEIKPRRPFFDYAAKYTPGETMYLVPAPLEPTLAAGIQQVGLRAHQALGCRHFSRTDLIVDQTGRTVVLEVNTIPGLTPMSLLPKAAACVGVSYEELCERFLQMAAASTVAAARVALH